MKGTSCEKKQKKYEKDEEKMRTHSSRCRPRVPKKQIIYG